MHQTQTFGCNSLCGAAGTLPFMQSQDYWQTGGDIGAGFLMMIPGSPVALTVNYTHIFVPTTNLTFMSPGPVPVVVTTKTGADINLATVGFRSTFGGNK